MGNLGQSFSLPGHTSLTSRFLKILTHSSGERRLPADLLSQLLVREEMRTRCGQRRGGWAELGCPVASVGGSSVFGPESNARAPHGHHRWAQLETVGERLKAVFRPSVKWHRRW